MWNGEQEKKNIRSPNSPNSSAHFTYITKKKKKEERNETVPKIITISGLSVVHKEREEAQNHHKEIFFIRCNYLVIKERKKELKHYGTSLLLPQ